MPLPDWWPKGPRALCTLPWGTRVQVTSFWVPLCHTPLLQGWEERVPPEHPLWEPCSGTGQCPLGLAPHSATAGTTLTLDSDSWCSALYLGVPEALMVALRGDDGESSRKEGHLGWLSCLVVRLKLKARARAPPPHLAKVSSSWE